MGQEPNFAAPEEKDFHLRDSSPAHDAGVAFPGAPATGKDGNPPPQRAAIDLGAERL